MTEPVLSPPLDSPATLFDVEQVASILNVSARTIYRMSDAGAMPRPIKVGAVLSRYYRHEIVAWILAGCVNLRTSRPAR